jgi:hypothetical protein
MVRFRGLSGLVLVATLCWTCFAATPAGATFTPIAGFDSQIFPSYIIATAPMRPSEDAGDEHRLGDPRGLLGVEVVAPEDGATVRVTVECAECMEPSVFVGKLPTEGETYRVFPKVKYKYAWLGKRVQAAPVSMTFRVQVGDEPEQEDVVACTVRPVNDCPFTLYEGETSRDVSYTFAAYVNEQHPFVDKLLREALDREIVDGFTGYQSKDPHEVMRQAYALWDLLVARDMRYSSITVSAVSSQTVASQHVRLIEDSVNNSQANCVDGSVLWASLMQRIGIDSFLVMEPTHCYAGFFTDESHETAYAIETTMLGADFTDEEYAVPTIIEEGISEDLRDDRSFASFAVAVNYSTARLAESLARKSADASGDEAAEEEADENAAPPCDIIDIAQARALGVLPIAFTNGEEFTWYEYNDDEAEEYAAEEEEEYSEEAEEEFYESDASDAEDYDADEESWEEDDDEEYTNEEAEYSEDEAEYEDQ